MYTRELGLGYSGLEALGAERFRMHEIPKSAVDDRQWMSEPVTARVMIASWVAFTITLAVGAVRAQHSMLGMVTGVVVGVLGGAALVALVAIARLAVGALFHKGPLVSTRAAAALVGLLFFFVGLGVLLTTFRPPEP